MRGGGDGVPRRAGVVAVVSVVDERVLASTTKSRERGRTGTEAREAGSYKERLNGRLSLVMVWCICDLIHPRACHIDFRTPLPCHIWRVPASPPASAHSARSTASSSHPLPRPPLPHRALPLSRFPTQPWQPHPARPSSLPEHVPQPSPSAASHVMHIPELASFADLCTPTSTRIK